LWIRPDAWRRALATPGASGSFEASIETSKRPVNALYFHDRITLSDATDGRDDDRDADAFDWAERRAASFNAVRTGTGDGDCADAVRHRTGSSSRNQSINCVTAGVNERP